MTSIVFPGQGSQFLGMAKDFYKSYPQSKEIFEIVENTTNLPIKDIIFDNKEGLLDITKYTQLSIFTASVAIYEAFKSIFPDLKVNFFLGHSLGEYSALTASNIISLEDCAYLLKNRGDIMNSAYPVNKSGMAAIIGLSCDQVENIIKENAIELDVANDNSPSQVVISGIMNNIQLCENIFMKNGAKKFVYLNVSAAFHSKIMEKAQQQMQLHLKKVTFKKPSNSVISNFSGTASTDEETIFKNLSNQMSNKVRWVESINYLEKTKEENIIEIGPGKVLSGLIKRITTKFNVYNLNRIEDIEGLKELK